MSEKGGKGFSAPEESLNGKGDSSVNSKKGKNVQFEGSAGTPNGLSNGGKTQTPNTKVDWSKVGKGGRTVNGGKKYVVKEPPPLELNVEQELPKKTKCLMDCEAEHILRGIQDQMIMLSEDPTIKTPVAFDKALQYAKMGSHYTNPRSIRPCFDALKTHGVTDGEICMIANICPETVDEVFPLIPSLKDKKATLREPLGDVLSQLSLGKRST